MWLVEVAKHETKCEKIVPSETKKKYYKTVVKLKFMYGSNCWSLNEKEKRKLNLQK